MLKEGIIFWVYEVAIRDLQLRLMNSQIGFAIDFGVLAYMNYQIGILMN